MESSSGGHNLPRIQVFRPTMDEFKDFPRFIEFIELQGAHKAGVAKIIPPKEWIPRRSGYDDVDLVIPAPIRQSVSGNKGLYQQYNIQQKPMHVKEFAKLANDSRYQTPRYTDFDELERKFWKNITFNPAIYGADISGSLYDKDQDIWNINRLGTILDRVGEEYSVRIEGVNTAYLYFGMWKTSFCWHTEDMDLYSINYIHYGAPKSWYAIPPEHGRRLERLAAGFFPNEAKQCSAFLRHKMTHISPHVLRRYSIPFNKITQEVGEFMITFPYCYHAGFNHGYNCAESTNFASVRWIEYGKRCQQCTCDSDMVRISMDCFIKNYQPERYELWKAGNDMGPHPEDDQSKLYSSSSSTKSNVLPEITKQPVTNLPSNLPQEASMNRNLVSRRHPVAVKLLPKKDDNTSAMSQSTVICEEQHVVDINNTVCVSETDDVQRSQTFESLKCEDSNTGTPKRKKLTEKEDRRSNKRNKMIELSATFEGTSATNHKSEKDESRRLLNERLNILDVPCGSAVGPIRVTSEHSYMSAEVPRIIKDNGSVSFAQPYSGFDSLGSRIQQDNKPILLSSQSAFNPAFASYPGGSTHYSIPAGGENQSLRSDLQFVNAQTSHTAGYSPGSYFLDSFNLNPSLSDFKSDVLLISEDALNEEEIVELSEEQNDYLSDQMTSRNLSDDSSKELEIHNKSRTQKKENLKADWTNPGKQKNRNKAEQVSVVSKIQKTCPQLSRVAELFQCLPADQNSEIEYNYRCSLVEPYCDVCSIFVDAASKQATSSESNSGVCHSAMRPDFSSPLVPSALFAHDLKIPKPENVESHGHFTCGASSYHGFNASNIFDVKVKFSQQSQLLICSHCHLCVHASCYGELNVSRENVASWTCDRCLGGTFSDACCLCLLRGGALKRTTTGQWAHIVCALVISEAGFEDVTLRSPIKVQDISSARRKLKCSLCLPVTSEQFPQIPHRGVCVQCTSSRCSASFHVTCARAAGLNFKLSDSEEQSPISISCFKHNGQKCKEKEKKLHCSLPSISTGDHVIAKHKNGRYYRCLVLGVQGQVFFHVEFDDGSFSTDTYPEDIESPSCSALAPPPRDSAVKVRWSDGLLYDAIFKGTNFVCLIQVQFEDGSVLNLERKDVWSEKEELPKKVSSRMSIATETRHNLFQGEPKEMSSRTRSVQLCYIRDQNFVNP